MANKKYDFGMVGLGVMGRNFLLNVADSGFSIIGLDNDPEKAAALEDEAEVGDVKGTTSMQEFVTQLNKPRRIMLLVPAGEVVDKVINDLLEYVERDDLIIDGGNSHFDDTDRRTEFLANKGIRFLGVGVSGGAAGARRGPSIMPGGSQAAYEAVRPILEEVSAKVGDDPCVAFMGNGAAGHYVKMVHNGIEYSMMQLLSESYDILSRVGGFSNQQLHQLYSRWNEGRLSSFLVEITAKIFGAPDDLGDGDLIDVILDKAKQKGTGKWTSQSALDYGTPTPSIDAAVTMRQISSFKKERVAASKHLTYTKPELVVDAAELAEEMEQAVEFAFIVSYAQGMNLLAQVSEERNYELDLEACARIWRGGCIIRAAMLEDIRAAYAKDRKLKNLIDVPVFAQRLVANQRGIRNVLKLAIDAGVPALTLSTALNYFDSFRAARLPLNLVQAQRDFFGSHTYQRIDKEGAFHTDWDSEKSAMN